VELASSAVRQKLAAADPTAAAAIREVVAEIGGNIRAASRRASDRLRDRAGGSRGTASGPDGSANRTSTIFADARKFEQTQSRYR
jgi:hypothetical protein